MTTPINVGDVLAGKYQVERILGAGGMGVVVAARHLMLGERVAIKLLLPQALAREDIVKRFLREGQAAARIRSEHVSRVFDVSRLDSGEPYLVMEYLEGTDLGAASSASGPLPVAIACEYVLQACEALAEAHALGIVHRDLKPSNLFLSQRADGSALIKILDFGISKMALEGGAEPAKGSEITQTSVMMGSPLYMAPEQMVSTKSADARSDIWSMGVILHQLLTSATPFNGESVMEIYDRILQGPPPIRNVRPDAPERLEWVILRCLRKNPTERFGNVAELAAELAAFAPSHAWISAERAARVLKVPVGDGSGNRARISVPAAPFPAADGARPSHVPALHAAPSVEGRDTELAVAEAGTAQGLGATDRSWSGTGLRASRAGGGNVVLRIAAGAMAVVVAAGLGWLVVSRSGAAPASVTTSSSEASADAPPEALVPEARPPARREASAAPVLAGAAPDVAPAVPSTAPDAGAAPTAPDAPMAPDARAAPTAPRVAAAGPDAASAAPLPAIRSARPAPRRPAQERDLFGDPR